MALLATFAESSAVWLVSAVTALAVRRELLIFGHGGVAGMTVELGVRVFQREMKASRMIEVCNPPGSGRMAVCAFDTEPPHVTVV